MTPIIQSASLCPIRSDGESIEVLLTRRAFWNYERDRPMRYPGEWVFPGGQYEERDIDLVETAVREFREELKYGGQVGNTRLLRSATQPSHGKEYFVEFYAAQLEEDPSFTLHEQGEVIGVQWMAPAKALELIHSDQFTREQLEQFKQKGLGDSKYGIHAVTERQFPVQNVQTLELIQAMPELVGLYKNE